MEGKRPLGDRRVTLLAFPTHLAVRRFGTITCKLIIERLQEALQ